MCLKIDTSKAIIYINQLLCTCRLKVIACNIMYMQHTYVTVSDFLSHLSQITQFLHHPLYHGTISQSLSSGFATLSVLIYFLPCLSIHNIHIYLPILNNQTASYIVSEKSRKEIGTYNVITQSHCSLNTNLNLKIDTLGTLTFS